jgi:hypothetical protein
LPFRRSAGFPIFGGLWDAWRGSTPRSKCEADCILQFGHDETQIMRQGTMNLWALTWGKNKKLKIVTMEAAGLLIGGTSRGIAHRIKTQFGRMQAAVLLARGRLGEHAGRLCTMANGGGSSC